MARTIHKEIKTIENKYNELLEEIERLESVVDAYEFLEEDNRLKIFIETLQELQTTFSMDGRDDLMMVTTDEEHGNYTLVALDRKKIKLVFDGGNK